jgi:DNA-binding CsgD family transcriptional regulator/tetratricopeptide (TPR) repeat protein
MATEIDLIEREPHLASLAALLEDARRGDGRVALVHGEAGIGKTALVERFVRLHGKARARVLWGGCDPLATPLPLAPVLDIAWLHGGTLAERVARGASRDDVFRAYIEALRDPSLPTIAVIEDVHWADEATLDLVRFIGRRAERLRALVIVTWRDDELGPGHLLPSVLGELPRGVSRRIALHGLSAEAVEALAARAQRTAAGLHAATHGNPFFVLEVLGSDGAGVPPTVRDAVLARAGRLSRDARRLCELASVSPSRVELPVLAGAAGASFAALDELLAVRTLALVDDAVAFRHELARRAIEDSLPPLRARELHARMLAALGGLGEQPGQLARLVHHAAGAGDAASLLRFAPAAAEHASRLGAHREAERHLAAALRHADGLAPRRRAELLGAHSLECYLTDRMADAIASRTAACALWRELGEPARESDALIWLARMLWFEARSGEARDHAARAVETLAQLPPGRELAMAWGNRAVLYAAGGDPARALEASGEALRLARSQRCADVESYALNTLGCARVAVGDDQGWSDLEHSLRIAQREQLPDLAARAYGNLGSLAVEQRRYRDAERWLDAAIAFTGERDLATRLYCALAWRARLRTEVGRWADADDDAARVLANRSTSAMFRLATLTALGLLRARRGDPEARSTLDEAWSLARRSGEPERLVPVAAARAELAWLSGDRSGAVAEASPTLEAIAPAGRAWYVADLALWVWRGGGRLPSAAPALPVALQLRGDWRAASGAWQRLGSDYHAALACHEGDDPGPLVHALATLDRLGARPAAARVRRRLAELGVRGVPRGPRAARRAHPFDLTAREQEVLATLALGLSNDEIGARLFVSPKTVDHHVSAILAKLGVKSRGAAVAEAHRGGLVPQLDRPRRATSRG